MNLLNLYERFCVCVCVYVCVRKPCCILMLICLWLSYYPNSFIFSQREKNARSILRFSSLGAKGKKSVSKRAICASG